MTDRPHRVALLLAAVLFVAVAVAGFGSLPPDREWRPLPLVLVVLVLAPLTTAANAAEYALTARYVGVRVGSRDAVRIAVLSTAANLLPVPGAALLRTAALRRAGIGTARAAGAVAAAAVLWLSSTAAIVAIVVAVDGDRPLGVAALGLLGAIGTVVAHRLAGAHRRVGGVRTTSALLVVEAGGAIVGAARLWLCARAIGFDIGAGSALALTSAAVLASAAGVVPAGLGLREALAGAIGPLVAVPAAVAASASAVDRVLGLPVVGLAAVGFAAGAGRAAEEPAP